MAVAVEPFIVGYKIDQLIQLIFCKVKTDCRLLVHSPSCRRIARLSSSSSQLTAVNSRLQEGVFFPAGNAESDQKFCTQQQHLLLLQLAAEWHASWSFRETSVVKQEDWSPYLTCHGGIVVYYWQAALLNQSLFMPCSSSLPSILFFSFP